MLDSLTDNSFFDYQGINHISDDALIFPNGDTWQSALFNLANYPYGTELYEIETIGAIVSFLSDSENSNKSERHLNTCIYVDNLIELSDLGYLEGVTPITRFQYDLNQFNMFVGQGAKLNNEGDIILYTMWPTGPKDHIIEKPKIEKYVTDYLGTFWEEQYRTELISEYEENNKKFIEITNSLKISKEGYEKYVELSQQFIIPKKLKGMVNPLIKIGYYDSAIRDISVFFEQTLKQYHKSNLMGWKLIEQHITECVKANKGNYNAGIKIYRQELRTMNSFVRNEFMHNIINVDRKNYFAILYRQCRLFNLMEHALSRISAYDSDSNN